MAKHNSRGYEILFNAPAGEITEQAFEKLRHENVFRYKTRTIKSGDILEIEVFPVYRDYKDANRALKQNATKEAQAKLNERNALRALCRKANANFTKDDLHVTLTYKKGVLPDEKKALKDMQGYIRRVRYCRNKKGLPELKYIYVIEFFDGDGRRTRVHHHVIMSGMDRLVVKSLWPHGERVNVDELVPENGSLEGLARYIAKQPGVKGGKQSKRWQASRNLIPYTKKTESEHKLSKKQAERLASDVKGAAPQIFAKHFSEYALDECTVKSSEFVAGAYIYAKMHKDAGSKNCGRN